MPADKLTIDFPEGLEQSVRLTADELKSQIRLMAALKMFELGKLSSGRAAELAGMSRPEFFDACALYRVSVFNYGEDEAATEIQQDFDRAARASAP